ncbi:MAG: hypothetical protein VXZ38_05015 [Planctomycetota bacterium]|nr:hypothetical protein [Planctomycetota bacterium]
MNKKLADNYIRPAEGGIRELHLSDRTFDQKRESLQFGKGVTVTGPSRWLTGQDLDSLPRLL